jgi:hypothetical protein
MIVGMGLLVYTVLRTNDAWANGLCPYDDDDGDGNNSSTENFFGCRHEYIAYYLLGLVGVLICLGIFGCVFLCRNQCQIPNLGNNDNSTTATTRYSPAAGEPTVASSGDPSSSYQPEAAAQQDHYQERSQFYRHQRQRRHRQAARRRSNDNNSCCAPSDPCDGGCTMCCYPRYG